MKVEFISYEEITNLRDLEIIEVDGSVNRNPGEFGIVGAYKPHTNQLHCFKYRANRMTNQLAELLAIYHGLEISNSKPCIIVSDSMFAIKALCNQINVRDKRLKYVKTLIETVFEDHSIYLTHRRGHTKEDIVGKYITSLMQKYNKTGQEPDIKVGSLQYLIEQLEW